MHKQPHKLQKKPHNKNEPNGSLREGYFGVALGGCGQGVKLICIVYVYRLFIKQRASQYRITNILRAKFEIN